MAVNRETCGNHLSKTIADRLTIAAISLVLAGLVAYLAGVRINTSKSIPLGLYWISPVPVAKGDYLIFCPPACPVINEAKRRKYLNAGLCPGGYGQLMKVVVAIKGDVISINRSGVWVNGQRLPNSQPLPKDAFGRPLPQLKIKNYVLAQDQLLLMTNRSPISFDARYFGPVSLPIKAVIRPIFTW